MTRAFRPRLRADSMPAASARLEMTTMMLASRLPAAILSEMASKFEPRPERRMPRFFITHDVSAFQTIREFPPRGGRTAATRQQGAIIRRRLPQLITDY